MYKRLSILLLASLALAVPGLSTSAEAAPRSHVKQKPKRTLKSKPSRLQKKTGIASTLEVSQTPLAKALHGGYFRKVSPEKRRQVEAQYLKDKNSSQGLNSVPSGQVKRVKRQDLKLDFANLSSKEESAIRKLGIKQMSNRRRHEALRGTAYRSFSKLHYFTSGAGLWSRGGGQIKALIPLNLTEVLSSSDFALLEQAGEVVAAKTPEAARLAAGKSAKTMPDAQVIEAARGQIATLISKAQKDPRSINILDLKMANATLLSKSSSSYIHFDIWTSSQTHEGIRSYLSSFKEGYKDRVFHPNAKKNKEIISAIDSYFAASKKLGETHLFGYQRGLHALDVETGMSKEDTVAIGEGAGMAKSYLNESGRNAQLSERGAHHWVFQNIEVISDIALEFGAYRAAQSPVAVVVVPTKKGYSGGSPYRVESNGNTTYQLLEASAVPKSLAEGNAYFNTNSIYQRIDLAPITNIGYELKDNGTVARLKMNAGDVTLTNQTSLIGGRIGKEYETSKTYGEFGSNGAKLIKTVQDNWSAAYL